MLYRSIAIFNSVILVLLLGCSENLAPTVASKNSDATVETIKPAPPAAKPKTSLQHINSIHEIAKIIEEYKALTGKYPFQEKWQQVKAGFIAAPVFAHLTTKKLPQEYRYPPHGVSGSVCTSKAFEQYLSHALKRKIVLPKDDRKIRSSKGNWPFYYQFMFDGRDYYVACYLQESHPSARRVGKDWFKYEVSSIAVPRKKILRFKDIK